MSIKDVTHLFFVVLDNLGHFSPSGALREEILQEMLEGFLLCDLLCCILWETRDARIRQIDLISKKIADLITWVCSFRTLFVEAYTWKLSFESTNERNRSEFIKEVLFCQKQLGIIDISILRIFDVLKLFMGEKMLFWGYLQIKINLNFVLFSMELLDEGALWVDLLRWRVYWVFLVHKHFHLSK